VQRTDAGPCSIICRSRSATASTTKRHPRGPKALYATGFFRDVRLEVENDVLVVIVQERPTISQIDIVGTKEFDKDTLRKALKGYRRRRVAHLRSLGARSRGAGIQAPVHQSGYYAMQSRTPSRRRNAIAWR